MCEQDAMSKKSLPLLAAKVDEKTHREAHDAARAMGTTVAEIIKKRLAAVVRKARRDGLITEPAE